ncbi:hypothetical protein CTI12_AA322170 [Artemisia annua]|uniref:Uncharacterized protein n=1 Tax=Artemisia annua TaxID=35608 RepID=A0A2U1N0N0_ARTAN|nr:hypothetical protein CTI12_AA322170 [Artemisia annua]
MAIKSHSFSRINVEEDEWVESMRKSIVVEHHEAEEAEENPVCIFTVPQVLLATNPESYVPQCVALGPFHHKRAEVYDMQRYKLAAARRTQQHMSVSFERVVETMKESDEARIRACYHKSIDMSADALIWMMTVDMAFLLEFLEVYNIKDERRMLKKNNSGMSHVVNVTGKKLSHMVILRDLVMVENQLPMFLITKMLEYQNTNAELQDNYAEEKLKKMLMGLYHELSPFKEKVLADVDINSSDHLLDFLYHLTVPNREELGIMETEIDIEQTAIIEVVNEGGEEQVTTHAKDPFLFFYKIWNILTKAYTRMSIYLRKIIFGLLELPWKIISMFPLPQDVREPLERMFHHEEGKKKSSSSEEDDHGTPTMEEIKIPSATEMVLGGISFSPVNGGIYDIRFDKKTSTLYLPVIDLDINTEVFLRNLVAYEACKASGPSVVARYTELMNMIINTEEDAKYLREKGIVYNHLKNDKEVADIWNTMNKSVKLTKVAKMDKVIKDVNKRHGRTWKVKFTNFMNIYVFGSWKFLTAFGAMFLMFVTGLQAFCTLYSCGRVTSRLPGNFQGGGANNRTINGIGN